MPVVTDLKGDGGCKGSNPTPGVSRGACPRREGHGCTGAKGLSCHEMGRLRCVDREEEKGTPEICAEWTASQVGNDSATSFRLEQTQRRKRGGTEVQQFGGCWVETVFTKNLKRRAEEEEGGAGALWSGRGRAGTFPLQRRRDR